MSDPATLEEYNRLATENSVISGFGLETSMTLACPGCAAKGFLPYRIIDSEEAMKKGAVCKECGRGFRMDFTYLDGGKQFEIVQTEGKDVPSYLPPIRRVP